jgi:hypothetical protein
MELLELINKINQHHGEFGEEVMLFPSVVDELSCRFYKQVSDIEGIDNEWVWQLVDQFECCYGELAYKFGEKFLVFGFHSQ